jgi:HK97 family phage portal protein
MGIFTSEKRDAFPYPVIPSNAASSSSSIRSVSLNRADAAMQKVAIFASVNLIANVTSMLPINVYRGVGVEKTPLATARFLQDLGGQGHGTSDWLWQAMYSACLRGNAVGRVVDRNPKTGLPTTVDLLHPDDVSVAPDPNDTSKAEWRSHGKVIPAQDMWHRRVYPTPGRVLGLSPIALHATTISEGLYAQNFGAQWFLDGGHPSSILTNDKAPEIDQGTARTVKDRFLAAVRGTREPVVLGGGWKYQQIQIAPGESQFLETQGYTSAECARIYGPGMPEILGYETGNSMTYANIEQRSVDLLKYTLDFWLTRAERWLSEMLPQPQYVRFDRGALLRTDALTRYQKHQMALKNGLSFINEIRTQEEDLAAVPWGNEPYLPALGPAAAAAAVNDGAAVSDTPAATPAPQGGQQT